MSQRRLPAEIYWRRRLLLLAVLILIVWVGLQLWPDPNDERPVSSTAPTATPSPTPDPVPSDGTTTVSLSSGDAACDPESIRISPAVPSGQKAREPVEMNLTIGSTAKKPCTFTADSSDLLVIISAGKTAIWDSTVCKTALLTDEVQLSPGWSTVVPVEWSGRGSGPACSSKEGWATPGRYTVQIGTLGGEPGEVKFTLAPPEKPKDDEKKKSDEDENKKSDEDENKKSDEDEKKKPDDQT